MYPVRLNFQEVIARIQKLMANEHFAEALVTSMFTFEKLVKRSLRRAIVARGFTIKQADRLLDKNGFDALVEKWDVFEKEHRTLAHILGNEWQDMPAAKKMRNDLVHGNRVFDLIECEKKAKKVILALQSLHKWVIDEYGVDPWQKAAK